MILTALQVAGHAFNAGFTGNQLAVAVAIAHAESGFNPGAVGDVNLTEPEEQSTGLWQINYRPSRDRGSQLRDPILNLDPAQNAVSAWVISGHGQNFTPWSTFTSGAYAKFMPEATAAAQAVEKGATLAATIVGFAVTPTGKGYWIVFSDGAVFAFGDAVYAGRPVLDATGIWVPE